MNKPPLSWGADTMSLYSVTLVSVDADGVGASDSQGNKLYNIGNIPIHEGHVYYTDGQYIYGWKKRGNKPPYSHHKQTVKGIPVMNWATDEVSILSPQNGAIKKRYAFEHGKYFVRAFVNNGKNAYMCIYDTDSRQDWIWYDINNKTVLYTEHVPYVGYMVDAQCTADGGLMVLYRDGSVKVNGATTHESPTQAALNCVQASGDAVGVSLNRSDTPSRNASGGAYIDGITAMWDGRIFDSSTYYAVINQVKNQTWVHHDFRYGNQDGDNSPVEMARFSLFTNSGVIVNNGSVSCINDTYSLSIGGYHSGFYRRAFFTGVEGDEYIDIYNGYGLLTSYNGKGFVMIPNGPSGEIGQYVAGWDMDSLPSDAEKDALLAYGDEKAEEAFTTSPHFWSGGENTGAYRDSYPLNGNYKASKTEDGKWQIGSIYTSTGVSRHAYVYDCIEKNAQGEYTPNGQHLILDGAVYKDNKWIVGGQNTRLYPMSDIKHLVKNIKSIFEKLNEEEEEGNDTP